MERFIQYAGLFAGLVILTIGVALVVVGYRPALLKPLVVQHVEESHQRILTLGDLQLSLYPRITLRINDVSLSEYRRDDVFATVDEIGLSLQLIPLLKRRLIIDRMTVDGLKAEIVRFRDGTFNIADFLEDEGAVFFNAYYLAQAQVENSRLTLRDEVTQRLVDLDALRLKAVQVSTDGVRQLEMENRLTLIGRESENELHPILAQLNTRFEVENVSINTGNSSIGPVFFSVQTRHDNAVAITRHFSAHVSITGADFVDDVLRGQHLHFGLAVQHDAQIVQAALDTAFAFHTGKRAGTVSTHLAFDFFHPEYTSQSIHGNFKGHLDLDWMAELLQMDMQGQIGGNRMHATARLEDFSRQIHTFSIAIDTLDLTAFLPTESPDQSALSASSTAASAASVVDENLSFPDLSMLDRFALNGSIHIGRLNAGDIQVSGIQLIFQPGEHAIVADQSQ